MDHLLSVLGLLLIVRGRMLLLTAITALTVAHSMTLAIATRGYGSAPLPLLNAAMPLSILFPLLLVDLTPNGPSYIVLPVHDPGALYCRVTRDNRVVHTDKELVPGDEVDARRLRKMYDQWSSGHQVETTHHCLRS